METKNYHITDAINNGSESHIFLWRSSERTHRVGDAMPAVFDFREDGTYYRIEILFVQGRLTTLNRQIDAEGPKADSKYVFQVGGKNPTSFVLRMDSLGQKKSHSHTPADAWLLEDDNGQIVGVEAVLPQ